jgi:uncharacterized delta-60 repeat protein
MKKYLDFALFILLMAPGSVPAADGDLDVNFGTAGKVTTDFELSALAVQSNGKMVVAGPNHSLRQLELARYNIDGSLDTTFGSEGKLTTDLFGGYRSDLALQSDGKIVVVSNVFPSISDFWLARYNSDGSVDRTFGTAGKVAIDFHLTRALALQPDGKIVVAGSSSGNQPALCRYNGDGSLDPSFGAEGKISTGFTGQALALQSDGRIVVAGFVSITPSYSDFALARYTGDGSVDTTFGTGGKVITAFYPNYDYRSGAAYAVALQSDGKIVAAGGDLVDESGLRLARYNSDGSLDTTFGIGGKVTNGVDAASLAIQSDGKIIIGTFPFVDAALIRYNNDGSLDRTFGTGGYVSGDGGNALALQFDGKIVAVSRYSLARYNNGLPILRFDAARVPLGGSFTATFSGLDLTDETYFDVRFRTPGSYTDQVALNWQRGLSQAHDLSIDLETGTWNITGVRPHQEANDHTTDFVLVSTALTVTP